MRRTKGWQRTWSWAAIAVALGAVLTTSACRTVYADMDGARMHQARRTVQPSGDKDTYLEVKKGGKGTDGQRNAFARLPMEFFPMASVQIRAGIFDPKYAEDAGNSITCLEFDELQSSPLQFAGICGFYQLGSSYAYYVEDLDGDGTVGQSTPIEFPATLELQYRLSFTMSEFNFEAKKPADVAWTSLGTVGYTFDTPFLIGAGGAFLDRRTRLGLDDFQVLQWGANPAPTADEEILEHLFGGSIYTLDAYRALDAGVKDFPMATTYLTMAWGEYDMAGTSILALPDPDSKENRKALKLVEKANKKVEKALDKVADQKEKPALKQIKGILKKADKAAMPYINYSISF
jgi:hypothetical protein